MCVYSMVLDHYTDKWKKYFPSICRGLAEETIPVPYEPPFPPVKLLTQEGINEFRKLLKRAREYDRRTDQKDYELEGKKKTIRELAVSRAGRARRRACVLGGKVVLEVYQQT